MLEEVHGLVDEAIEINLINKEWTGASIVEKSADR
jgi:hypothetical protein